MSVQILKSYYNNYIKIYCIYIGITVNIKISSRRYVVTHKPKLFTLVLLLWIKEL